MILIVSEVWKETILADNVAPLSKVIKFRQPARGSVGTAESISIVSIDALELLASHTQGTGTAIMYVGPVQCSAVILVGSHFDGFLS